MRIEVNGETAYCYTNSRDIEANGQANRALANAACCQCLEDPKDLIADLKQGLRAAGKAAGGSR